MIVDHRKPLDNSYTRYCAACGIIPIHYTNADGRCSPCVQANKQPIVEKLMDLEGMQAEVAGGDILSRSSFPNHTRALVSTADGNYRLMDTWSKNFTREPGMDNTPKIEPSTDPEYWYALGEEGDERLDGKSPDPCGEKARDELVEECRRIGFNSIRYDTWSAVARAIVEKRGLKSERQPAVQPAPPCKPMAESTIGFLVNICHENAKQHGWWPDNPQDRNFGEALALVHSEISEALEEWRKYGFDPSRMIYFIKSDSPGLEATDYLTEPDEHDTEKLEGIAVELADALIRIFDLAGGYGIPLAQAFHLKHEFNKNRPYRHGGKLA